MQVYISNKEITEIAEGLVHSFCDGSPSHMVDIDAIAKRLGLTVVYESIAEKDQDKIGFASDGITPLLVWWEHKRVQVVYPKNTIVLDRFLLRPEEETRRRFTLAHEVSHCIINRADPTHSVACYNREYDRERSYDYRELRERMTLGEVQANAMAATILMPRFMVASALQSYNRGKILPIYGDNVFLPRTKTVLEKMCRMLGVSYTALIIQLRKYGLFEQHDINEYIAKNLMAGGAAGET